MLPGYSNDRRNIALAVEANSAQIIQIFGRREKGSLDMKNERSKQIAAGLCLSAAMIVGTSVARADDAKEVDRVKEAGNVLKDLTNSSNGIPLGLLNKSECVIVLPSVKKAGFIVGASYGRGLMSCRSGENFDGPWSAPTMMQSTGGSFGLQAGGQATDFVILVMNDKGARALMKGKLKLGADASVAAGPVGRDAEASTNASMSAEMLSYSRAQGVFAGVSLAGATLGPDNGANKNLYGKELTAEEIIQKGAVKPPASASELLAVLAEKSPKNVSAAK
jgi:SH3 domain-containing YSC84-like protein 1